jgi:hypothetical protein
MVDFENFRASFHTVECLFGRVTSDGAFLDNHVKVRWIDTTVQLGYVTR